MRQAVSGYVSDSDQSDAFFGNKSLAPLPTAAQENDSSRYKKISSFKAFGSSNSSMAVALGDKKAAATLLKARGNME